MHVVLIGPIGAGKSTLARLLAAALQRELIELDKARWQYYADAGYDPNEANRRHAERGFQAMYEYWKPFEIDAVERVVGDSVDAILDFGAGHSVYEDPEHLIRAQQVLGPHVVVLVLPSPVVNESLDILETRADEDDRGFVRDINTHFISHPSNALLADHTVFTLGQKPEDSSQRILGLITADLGL